MIISMPSNKTPGPDKVSMSVLKDRLPVVLGPITNIVNCSFATSTFPAAVARYFTMNILLIIHRVLCRCCKIFNLEHFTYYSLCPLLLLEDILFAVGTFYSLFIVSYLPLLKDILSGIFTGSII